MSIESSENVLPRSLANLSFEEIFELKNKIGEKRYNALISKTETEKQKRVFPRENKNRPREMSSKLIPPPSLHRSRQRKEIVSIQDRKPVDPRFSHSHGEFNRQEFEQNYKFLKKMRKKEKKLLTRELRNSDNDEDERKRIKLILQRMDNQNKAKIKRKQEDELRQKEREYQIKELKEGRRPQYHRKAEKKLFDLVSQFEELKVKGGLIRHIKRRRKKLTEKDRRKLNFLNFTG